MKVGLVGNPNSGKTTVFNALTGSRQRVGNWPGVTVERKSGFFKWDSQTVEVVDLPGIYSLISASESAIDERIASEYILSNQADVIVNVLDGSNLERNLYLTIQLIELQVPVILAVNMLDVARQRRVQILLDVLAAELDCPVVGLEAHRGKGIKALKQKIAECGQVLQTSGVKLNYPVEIMRAIEELRQSVMPAASAASEVASREASLETGCHLARCTRGWHDRGFSLRLLEGDAADSAKLPLDVQQQVTTLQQHIREILHEDADILIADTRYRFIHEITQKSLIKNAPHLKTWTTRIDDLVLNRALGIPIFLAVMYALFFFAINIGGAFQDFFDISSHTIFVDGFSQLLTTWRLPNALIAFLANGIGKGINTVITFIPVIGAMFLALAFLEDSGYMARAAFVVDRLMRSLGLPGKAFVPMIVGFGCNVPAVMGARTLENKRDRILTVMMSPFMSCGARLAIYAVFTAAFFPTNGHNVVFALYLIGIIMALLTGLLLRKTFLKGRPAPLVMELPPYHFPTMKTLSLHAWQRLKGFVFRAGKLIIPICILLGMLNSVNINGTLSQGISDSHSLLSELGSWLTPIFAPMGIHADNWPATVGLLTGVLAKEVVIGTLNTLYSQLGHLTVQADVFNFWDGMHAAILSVPANLSQLVHAFSNPVLAKAPVHTLDQTVYGLMCQHFDGQIGAMAYLLFVLLYIPCVSTTAAMLRELNRAWAWFAVTWATLAAYGVAVGFYQLATFSRHPQSSSIWVIGILLGFLSIICGMRLVSDRKFYWQRRRYEPARN